MLVRLQAAVPLYSSLFISLQVPMGAGRRCVTSPVNCSAPPACSSAHHTIIALTGLLLGRTCTGQKLISE